VTEIVQHGKDVETWPQYNFFSCMSCVGLRPKQPAPCKYNIILMSKTF